MQVNELRERVTTGVIALGMRELIGLTIRISGVVLLVRLLGPEEFGLYAGPGGIVALLTLVAQLSQETYLVRGRSQPSRHLLDISFTLLSASSLTVVAATVGVLVAFPSLLPDGFLPTLLAMLPIVVLGALWSPAQASLERSFRFGRLGMLELAGDVVFYAVALPLAMAGAGHWGPVAGMTTMVALRCLGGYVISGYRPSLAFSRAETGRALRYGTRYVSVSWIWTTRSSLNAIIVGHTVGTAAVGLVAAAIQIVDVLGVLGRAAQRVAAVAVAESQTDAARLARGLETGAASLLLANGSAMIAFTIISPWLIPLLYGPQWSDVVQIMPSLAAASIIASTSALGVSVLTTKDDLGSVAVVQYLRLGLMISSAWILTSAFGVVGYGFAELFSMCAMLLMPHYLRRFIPLSMAYIVALLSGIVPLLFVQVVPWPAALLLAIPSVMMVVVPGLRKSHAAQLRLISAGLIKRRGASVARLKLVDGWRGAGSRRLSWSRRRGGSGRSSRR